MKRLLVLVCCPLIVSVAHAAPAPGRKVPGPSAVEAARLKKNPPPGYLSHYLPDDRYKIAGGVWKYVSTDLDTYYHVPSSPNMMRQPASSVIGFANAHDAEEAGYVADPTDGTANRAAPSTTAPRAYLDGTSSSSEGQYVTRITAIMRASKTAEAAWSAKLQRNGAGGPIITPALRQILLEAPPQMRQFAAQVKAVKPPKRFARFHSMLVSAQRQEITTLNGINRSLAQGTLSLGGPDMMAMMRARIDLIKEAQRAGIDPRLFS